mgnify:CR=1 FL=1
MNIRFIDTSVMMNLLEVPGRCSDSQMIKEEFRQVLDNKEVLILPIATIIETGNHIAHINNGNSRRTIASKFGEFLSRGRGSMAVIWYRIRQRRSLISGRQYSGECDATGRCGRYVYYSCI